MSTKLFDINSEMMVVASILQNPSILMNTDRYTLTASDFNSKIYQIIFSTMFNLVVGEGVESVQAIDIDFYLKEIPQSYEIFQANNGLQLLHTLEKMESEFDEQRFSRYYNRLKKFTILRDLEKNGFSTSEFYNPQISLDKRAEQEEAFNKLTPDDIIKRVQSKLNKVEDAYVSRNYSSTQIGSEGIRELYHELKTTPDVGEPLDGDILNYIVRGARYGKTYLNSLPTGQGKTRTMVGNAMGLSMPYILPNGEVFMREKYSKVLFIATEQQADEIQTLMLAYVSGVNERKILYGNVTPEEDKRVLQAIEIIEKYGDNFIIEVIADPNIGLIKSKMIKHILQNDVQFIFYDYIFSSPGLISEFSAARIREDVALMMLSNTIKEVAATYNVFVMSGTQLNDGWETREIRNQNQVRGSKAIADKVDIGMISIKLSTVPEEFEKIKAITDKAGLETPNMVVDIYKNRRGEFASVKLYRYFDYGTCRVRDIVLTDAYLNIITDYEKIVPASRKVSYGDLITGGIKNE